MDKPFLSIIVLCYNIEKYLNQCLDSILSQEFTDYEVIMVDDGSTDSTGTICDTYANKDKRFKVIHKENGGIIAARKTGINAASGIWCGSVDGDDWIEPDMYLKMCEAQTKYNTDFVQCGETLQYKDIPETDNKRKTNLYTGLEYTEAIRNQANGKDKILEVSLCRCILKTEKLKEIIKGLDDNCSLCEDAVCVMLYASASNSLYNIGEPLYNYRMRKGSCTNEKKTRSVEGLYKLYRYTEGILSNHPMKDDYLKYLSVYFIRHCMFTFLLNVKDYEKYTDRQEYISKEIENPEFVNIISHIPVSEYPIFLRKSMVECIVFKKVPIKWENTKDIGTNRLYS